MTPSSLFLCYLQHFRCTVLIIYDDDDVGDDDIYFSNVRDNKIENIGQACFGGLTNLNTL